MSIELSNRLQKLRQERGLTLEDVGARVGYAHATVSRHETGARALDGAAIDRYAVLYGVQPWEIWLAPEEAQRVAAERSYVQDVLEDLEPATA